MRTLGPEGFAAKKDRALNGKEQLGDWREQWANLANRHLERHGHEARVDHRSLKEQGADREPTTHLGYAANEMAQRGAQSERMDALQAVRNRNEIRVDMKAIDGELKALEKARTDALRTLQKADRTDRQALKNPAEQAFGEGARAGAQEVRQERRDAAQDAQQRAWREDVAKHAPKPGKGRGADSGLKVVSGATGAVFGLGNLCSDF